MFNFSHYIDKKSIQKYTNIIFSFRKYKKNSEKKKIYILLLI